MFLCSMLRCFIIQLFCYFPEHLAAESFTFHNANLHTDNSETHVATQCTVKPVPKKRLLLYSFKDTSTGDHSSEQVVTPAPRSILKQNGSTESYMSAKTGSGQSSATISPISFKLPTSPPLSPSDMLNRKQAHYSSIEQGEHSILDEDWCPLAGNNKKRDRSDYISNGNKS